MNTFLKHYHKINNKDNIMNSYKQIETYILSGKIKMQSKKQFSLQPVKSITL